MSRLYGEQHLSFQDQFDSRKMVDRIEELAVVTEISDETRAYIEARDMFFLATVDDGGRPTVSYKGGGPKFIKVLDDRTPAFPGYDGNGMFYSVSNIAANSQVGLLFIDFEKPHRLRVLGQAEFSTDEALLDNWTEADVAVMVHVSELWQNCLRYIHRYQKIQESRYVPKEHCETPIVEWKRTDAVRDVLRPRKSKRSIAVGPRSASRNGWNG